MPSVAKQGINLLFRKVSYRVVIPYAADAVRDLGPKRSSLSLIRVSFVLVVLFSGGAVRWSVELLDCLFVGYDLYLFFFFPHTFRFKVLFVFHYFSLGLLLGYLVLSNLVCVNLLFSLGGLVLSGTYMLLFLLAIVLAHDGLLRVVDGNILCLSV